MCIVFAYLRCRSKSNYQIVNLKLFLTRQARGPVSVNLNTGFPDNPPCFGRAEPAAKLGVFTMEGHKALGDHQEDFSAHIRSWMLEKFSMMHH